VDARSAPDFPNLAISMAKSAFRVLEILEYIAHCNTGATHTEIAAALKIPKSSLTELLKDLQRPGYLQMDEGSARFTIGAQVMSLSNAYLKGLNIVRDGAPFVHRIFTALNEFTSLLVPKEEFCVIVSAETPASPLAHSLSIGERAPMLASAAGKSILAFYSPGELDAYLAAHSKVPTHTPHTLVKLKDIREDLDEVRKVGLAYSREEYLLGITAIAAPVFNINMRPIASISVAVPTARLSKKLEEKIRATLQKETGALSARLGAAMSG
jgi:DNA-binding IclR family transcriptional regulator